MQANAARDSTPTAYARPLADVGAGAEPDGPDTKGEHLAMNKSTAELTGVTLDTLCADVGIEATYLGRREEKDKCERPHARDIPDDKWEHDAWNVSLEYKGRTYQDIAYRMGIGHSPQWNSGKPIKSVYDKEQSEKFYAGKQIGGPNFKPTPPTAADILSSLMMDVSGLDEGFGGWASGLGYDTDSRKAEATYKLCLETLPKLHALLGADFGRFETAAQDY